MACLEKMVKGIYKKKSSLKKAHMISSKRKSATCNSFIVSGLANVMAEKTSSKPDLELRQIWIPDIRKQR